MSFENFALAPELLRALNELGYTVPTPIQLQAIPAIMSGKDVMALAQTGTGKTAAFTIPMLHVLNNKHDSSKSIRQVRALILTPTRELAAQVGESVRNYGAHLSLHSEIVFGGVSITPQLKRLQRGTDIIIATPGRLLDLINQRAVNLSKVEILVLDEADRMLDMGFINDVKRIIALLPKRRQNMLFSATLSSEIQKLAKSILSNHKLIEVDNRNITTELVTQVVYQVDHKSKRELLSYLIGSNNWKQVLVFTRTKHHANKLCEQLIEDGLSAAALHGNKSQGARTKSLEGFKTGKIRVLVATDIAARGIDIDQLPHVINFELPNIAEDYVHRIGRTGRAGNLGHAISLVYVDELPLLKDIEKLIKKTIAKDTIPGFEPDRTIKTAPINKRTQKTKRTQNTRSSSVGSSHKNTTSRARPATNETSKPARTTYGERSRPARTGSADRRRDWSTDTKPARTTSGERARPARPGSTDRRRDWNTDAKPARTTYGERSRPARTGSVDRGKDWSTDTKPARTTYSERPRPARTGSTDRRRDWSTDAKPVRTTYGERSRPARTGSVDRRDWKSDSRPARTTSGERARPARTGSVDRRRDWSTDTKPARTTYSERPRPARTGSADRRSDRKTNSSSSRGTATRTNKVQASSIKTRIKHSSSSKSRGNSRDRRAKDLDD